MTQVPIEKPKGAPRTMPQASQEITEAMRELFGDPADDWSCLHYLWSLGYYSKGGVFTIPAKDWVQNRKLRVALQYLQDECDYGWEWAGPPPDTERTPCR
jgi:hypothetical protein